MKGFILVSLFGSMLICVSCTRCWHCENAANLEECDLSGYSAQCHETEICSTEVRRVYDETRIWKRCKQREACENQRLENWAREPFNCNNDQDISHCWCCCDNDSCNKNETCEVTSTRCPMLPLQFDRGQVTCSNANNLASICEYKCNEGFHALPVNKQTRMCLGNGKWSDKKPCCVNACPPFVPLDFVAITHSHNTKSALKKDVGFNDNAITLVNGKDYLQSFIIYFNEAVYKIVKPDDTARTGFFQPSANNTANTGAALWYIKNNILTQYHRRIRHSDVILVAVEKESDDDVTLAAAELKKHGATIYYVFYKNERDTVNMDEARKVASSQDHIFVVDELKESEILKIFTEVISNACDYECPIDSDD